jgi:hypothetical protein
MAKSTPAQTFAKIFAAWMHPTSAEGNQAAAEEKARKAAERRADAWLKKHNKTRADISAILAQAGWDDAAQNPSPPPPPPPDPRASDTHAFDDPTFTPLGLVDGLLGKYVAMPLDARVVYSAWICATHVYEQFSIAPRIILTSEEPRSGKTVAKNVAWHMVRRPNPETFSTAAALGEFLDEGPGTIMADELDSLEKELRRQIQLFWNVGHERMGKRALMVKGKRKLVSLFAPMLAAGIGDFFGPTQKSRAFSILMEQYTPATKPEREYTAATAEDFQDFDIVYSYLYRWARHVQLNLNPDLSGFLLRDRDNARSLVAVADSCGPEWGQRLRAALRALIEQQHAERPQITILRHGLAIFEALGVDQIYSRTFNRELKQLDLPDARWTRYRGASGIGSVRALEIHEQAALLRKVGIESRRIYINRVRGAGYTRIQFEEAYRKHCRDDSGRDRLRLIAGTDLGDE